MWQVVDWKFRVSITSSLVLLRCEASEEVTGFDRGHFCDSLVWVVSAFVYINCIEIEKTFFFIRSRCMEIEWSYWP